METELFEERQNTIKEYQKSQAVRVLDIFLVAPFLLYVGYKATGLKDWERLGVYTLAITTLVYNSRNFLKNNKEKRA